jgi:mannose-1-phosphate guanylyltransferase/phosphomannomutase
MEMPRISKGGYHTMQGVILAGGNAAQLHPWTPDAPKPLLPFFDRPVMEYAIRLLAKHDIKDVIITTSYLAKDVMRYFGNGSRWGVSIRYSIESEPMGSAGAVKLVQGMISDTFVVMSSDIVTDLDLRAAIQSHKSTRSIATVLLHEVDDPTPFGVVACDQSGRVSRFVEKPRSTEAFSHTVSTGIYILEPEALSSIRHFEAQDFARHLFPLLLSNQEPVHGCHLPGYWCDLGDLLQYRNAHFDALQGKIRLDLPAIYAGEGIWVGDGVDIHPSAQLASPVYIGSGASVGRDAVIGEHTIIGANAHIDEGAYVARSVIGGGAVIGREMNVTDTVIAGGYIVTRSEDKQVVAPERTDRPRSRSLDLTREMIA